MKLSKGKPVILLLNIILILVGIILIVCDFNMVVNMQPSLLSDIGISLISGGFITLFYFLYPSSDVEEEYNKIRNTGLLSAYDIRDLRSEYSEYLKKAKKHIDVLGLGLNKFREDNGEIIKNKCLDGVKVRFLVLDPESEMFNIKSKEEGDITGEVIEAPHKKLVEYVTEVNIKITNRGIGNKIEMKFYKSTPATMVFRIDDIMYVGPYLHKRPSRNTCTYKLESESALYKQYLDHFNKLWNDEEFVRVN